MRLIGLSPGVNSSAFSDGYVMHEAKYNAGGNAIMGRSNGCPAFVPGHGAPLTHAQFRVYRAAFDGLLACAAGDAPVADCAVRWEADLGPLLPEGQRRLSRMLLDYYFQNVLRAEPARRDRYCRAG